MLGLAGIPALLFSVASVMVYLNSDEIKKKLIAELSASLGGDIQIHGKIKFAFFRHIPNVALELQNVEMYGSGAEDKPPFVRASKVYLLAGLRDMIQSNWNIKTTFIENGEVTMLRTKNGLTNYRFAKAAEDSSVNSFAIAIDKALLKNIQFSLTDEINEVSIGIRVKDASVRGNFSAEDLSLKTIGNIYSQNVQIKRVDYAHQKQISFDGSLSVMPEKESYLLAIHRFMVGNNEFVINGSIQMENSNPVFDLAVSGKDVAITDLPMLLPAAYAARLKGVKGTGKVQITAEIKGRMDEKNDPLITILASTSGATMQISGMDSRVEELTFKGAFTNGTGHSLATASLAVTHLHARTRQGVLAAEFSLTNFIRPELKASARGMMDMSLFNGFFPQNSRLREMRGTVTFNDITYSGRISDLAAMRLSGLEGAVELKNVTMNIDTVHLAISEASFLARDNTLSISGVEMLLPGSKFFVSGKIVHPPGLSVSSGEPSIDLTVKAEKVDVPGILALFSSGADSDSLAVTGTSDSFGFRGTVRLNSAFIGWNKFKAYDASCTLALNGNIAEIKNFSCNTMDGILDMESRIERRSGRFISATQAKGSNINITELFYQLDNFNQQTITSSNVAGKLEFNADVRADFINGTLDEQSLIAIAHLTLLKGQLTNFQPLERLSRFIDIDELRNIRFSTLKNTVSISSRTVHLPEMIVKSNALVLSVSGHQTFDNMIDYHVKVNIFDILGKKFRKRKNAADYEQVGEDNFNLYISMTGTTDNPVIRHEKQTLKDRVARQKNDLQILKNERDAADGTGQTGVKEKSVFSGKKTSQEPEEELEFIEWEEPK